MPSSILFWNRLEPQPPVNDLSSALRCDVRDALWMLGRQWQMGEFRAEDAGTCAFVKAVLATFDAKKVSLRGGAPQDIAPDTPLNFLTEGVAPLENHSPDHGAPSELSLDLRVELGRRWEVLLKAKLPSTKAAAAVSAFKGLSLFHFKLPPAETQEQQLAHAATLANQPYRQMLSALSNGRALDGWELWQQLQTNTASSFLAHADPAVDQIGEDFKKWVTDTFPTLAKNAATAWNSSRLEYQFDCHLKMTDSVTNVLTVPEYDGSFLDWHCFDEGKPIVSEGPVNPDVNFNITFKTVLPRPVTFAGAPRNRWWEMEDSTIDLANLRPTAADTAHFVLSEFALLFSNDWLSFPLELPVGRFAGLFTVLATDVFGETTYLFESDQTKDWGLYSINPERSSGLWGPPVATAIVQAPPKQEVLLLRDEMANLAWGIENVVPDGLGGGMDGLDASISVRRWLEAVLGVKPGPNGEEPEEPAAQPVADRKYVLGTTVPDNWIPFVPIRFEENGQMRLRRAALPRTLGNRPPERIRPRTQILREGLESASVRAFDLNEEEITMPGIVVKERWRQARWFDGKIFTWLAREKAYARPTRASGLRFDAVDAQPPR